MIEYLYPHVDELHIPTFEELLEKEHQERMAEVSPTTGVYSGGDLAWEWMDNDFVDLQYEAAVAELTAKGMTDDDIAHELEYAETGTEQLYGDWLKDDQGLYFPDPAGEYAMIYDSNENVAQVVFSHVIKYGRPASPCYPGQVDARVNDPSEPTTYCYMAYYALPSEFLQEQSDEPADEHEDAMREM